MSTLFIASASSWTGKATARRLAAKGWQATATMRRPEMIPENHIFQRGAAYPYYYHIHA